MISNFLDTYLLCLELKKKKLNKSEKYENKSVIY